MTNPNYHQIKDTVHLSRSFFMGKKYSQDSRLIFYKKFLEPINVNKWKCLSQFNIRGFRTWEYFALKSILKSAKDNTNNVEDDLMIVMRIKENQHVIKFSQLVFLDCSYDTFLSSWKKSLTEIFKNENFDDLLFIEKVSENIFSFLIKSNDIKLSFSNELCNIFNLKKSHQYSNRDDKVIFFPMKHF